MYYRKPSSLVRTYLYKSFKYRISGAPGALLPPEYYITEIFVPFIGRRIFQMRRGRHPSRYSRAIRQSGRCPGTGKYDVLELQRGNWQAPIRRLGCGRRLHPGDRFAHVNEEVQETFLLAKSIESSFKYCSAPDRVS
ncbi:hypothetical protein LshimejAT787_0601760 [Lyophyllum shimeji]|uniref:Uncharacterized protein n=1 Tax=Lyophyllum shimeji TaxID=47721 RepID=A0A9P3PP91_LYOSH|nr:hypothetical protein LshimejAT787_0601760 [Lyophyllum shimeji]